MKKALILTAILIFSIVVLSGCTQQSNQQTLDQQKTCSQLNGYACEENEQCFGQLFNASDATTCCTVVCTQKSTQESSIKTCTEQNGTICKSGEKCEGNTVKASDAISCCSAACTKIEATQEKKLEELFTLADIPDYNINKELTGYERNALDYSEGDENHAREILTAGWQENYKAEFRRYSETKNAFGQNAELGYISVSISKYDKSKSPQNFLDNWINERNANFKAIIDTNKAEFEKTIKEQNLTLQSVSMLGGKIGDNSTIFKVGVHSDILDLDMKLYYIYFYKGNYNIYIVAGDLSRQINDEMAIEYARKIESRIP